MAKKGKPVRVKAPTYIGDGKELGAVLGEIAKATGIRKRRSNNPAHTPTVEGLRVRRTPKMPTADELLRDTAEPPLGMGRRAPGLQVLPVDASNLMPSADELFARGEEEGLVAPFSEGEDRKEYLSPPNSIEPGRPRATEASYDPQTLTLRVVFRDGGTYEYFGVKGPTWRALKNNRSFGQTLDRLVIGTYPFEHVSL